MFSSRLRLDPGRYPYIHSLPCPSSAYPLHFSSNLHSESVCSRLCLVSFHGQKIHWAIENARFIYNGWSYTVIKRGWKQKTIDTSGDTMQNKFSVCLTIAGKRRTMLRDYYDDIRLRQKKVDSWKPSENFVIKVSSFASIFRSNNETSIKLKPQSWIPRESFRFTLAFATFQCDSITIVSGC